MARNLIYHVTPMGSYRWNLYQLQKRISVFDGKIFIAIAAGPGLESDRHVRAAFPGAEIFPVDNDRNLRETASFGMLLARIEHETHRDDLTFYAHTKGVTHGSDPAVKLWTESLYYFNLDLLKQVELLFEKKGCTMVGSLVRHGVFDHFPAASKWHYAGTFFWFRNRKIFQKQNWQDIPLMKYGAEAWPSLVCPFKEVQVLFGSGIVDLYKYQYLLQILGPRLVKDIREKCA